MAQAGRVQKALVEFLGGKTQLGHAECDSDPFGIAMSHNFRSSMEYSQDAGKMHGDARGTIAYAAGAARDGGNHDKHNTNPTAH